MKKPKFPPPEANPPTGTLEETLDAEQQQDMYDLSSEETDLALPEISQTDIQDQRQAKSFVKRLTGLFGRRKLARFLRELAVFENIGNNALKQLAQRVQEVEFYAGETIIRMGDAGDRMYILAKGEVLIPVVDKTNHRHYSVTLEPGQIFGEMALLTGEPRLTDVIAQTDCHCLVLKKQEVDELIQQQPEIARLLTSILGKRLMTTGEIQEVGDYRLLGQLGQGGMALVFEAVHKKKNRVVAIKMLSHELVCYKNFAELFRTEAKVLSQLNHPNIVEFIDLQEAYATFFIVMEKLSGLDLHQRIERMGRFSLAETQNVLIKMAHALSSAHEKGIIHRDIKPSNVMFTEEGEVKVGDFGLAVQLQEDEGQGEQSTPQALEGTPIYMAPEQIQRQPLDRRTDIYAMGIMAYKMLTGTPPFQGTLHDTLHGHLHGTIPSLRKQLPNITPELEEFVNKATAKSPDDRFQDAQEILRHFGVASLVEPVPPVGVHTMTFVYSASEADVVAALIQECQSKVAANPGIRLHTSKQS